MLPRHVSSITRPGTWTFFRTFKDGGGSEKRDQGDVQRIKIVRTVVLSDEEVVSGKNSEGRNDNGCAMWAINIKNAPTSEGGKGKDVICVRCADESYLGILELQVRTWSVFRGVQFYIVAFHLRLYQ